MYYLYLKRASSRPWNLKIDRTYAPTITVIIPAHNEEKTIRFKLENLGNVIYPKEKMQVILIDDASVDKTMEEASKFVNNHPELNVKILSETNRRGKSNVLNLALDHAKYDIVVISDADTFWAPDILIRTLPYLADPSVGAVNGRQRILNADQSLVTQTEKVYLNLTYKVIKLGESKIFSTILFHGLFSAYKRKFLKEFNLETDDTGTALDIVQKGARTLYIPEAACFEVSPITWGGKLSIKVRRASQVVKIYAKCLRLLVKRQLFLPKRIAVPEIFLYLFNPVIFLFLLFVTFLLFLEFFPYSIISLLIIIIALLIPKSRLLFIELIQDHCILLSALFALISKRKFVFWKTSGEARSLLTRELLRSEGLI